MTAGAWSSAPNATVNVASMLAELHEPVSSHHSPVVPGWRIACSSLMHRWSWHLSSMPTAFKASLGVLLSLQAEAYRLQLARFYELLEEQKAPRGTAPRIAGLRNICKELRKVGCRTPANPYEG